MPLTVMLQGTVKHDTEQLAAEHDLLTVPVRHILTQVLKDLLRSGTCFDSRTQPTAVAQQDSLAYVIDSMMQHAGKWECVGIIAQHVQQHQSMHMMSHRVGGSARWCWPASWLVAASLSVINHRCDSVVTPLSHDPRPMLQARPCRTT